MIKFKIPKKSIKTVSMNSTAIQVGDMTFVQNGGPCKEYFHINPNLGTKIPTEDGVIVLRKTSALSGLTIGGTPRVLIHTSIKELESLLKKAKATKKKYGFRVFFKHLSPDVSIGFMERQKKSKVRSKVNAVR